VHAANVELIGAFQGLNRFARQLIDVFKQCWSQWTEIAPRVEHCVKANAELSKPDPASIDRSVVIRVLKMDAVAEMSDTNRLQLTFDKSKIAIDTIKVIQVSVHADAVHEIASTVRGFRNGPRDAHVACREKAQYAIRRLAPGHKKLKIQKKQRQDPKNKRFFDERSVCFHMIGTQPIHREMRLNTQRASERLVVEGIRAAYISRMGRSNNELDAVIK
jgi:hypothetical protein